MDAHSEDTEVVRRLFQKHVPEVASGVVEIRGIAREVGVLTMLSVHSADPAGPDTVGTCAGRRGSHLKEIAKELGEQIQVVRWSESAEILIEHLLAPHRVVKVSFEDAARVANVYLDSTMPARVEVPGPVKSAQPKLAARLAGWEIRIA